MLNHSGFKHERQLFGGLAMLLVGCVFACDPAVTRAQEVSSPENQALVESTEDPPSAPEQVEVEPTADDADIAARLRRILEATDWFSDPQVRVDEGVVFLRGRTTKLEYKDWAGALAKNTQDVVAVVNRIEFAPGSVWDFSPAVTEMKSMGRNAVQGAPLFLVACVLLLLTWLAAKLAVRLAGRVFERRVSNRLLRQVATNGMAVPVFILGLYFVLRISGLSQMAATVVGGTGLFGLVVGIAFRDIAENFLASILISMHRPFAIGDLIEVDGHHGYVQSVTTRGTLLMTLDGNHVQIPNSTIYKAVIRNLTANPKIRQEFTVGIGYDDKVTEAQETALKVLRDHPVVLDDPEPLVLVDQLGAATVNLTVYFWINCREHSMLKARSSMIRLVKQALTKQGISMPDEAREVVFPQGVPIDMLESGVNGDTQRLQDGSHRLQTATTGHAGLEEQVSNVAEGGFSSEAADIQLQAAQARTPEDGMNLLENEPRGDSAVAVDPGKAL